MFPLLIPLAAGAIGGALIDHKKPLRGALLGAGLGAGGAAAAPMLSGLLGGGAAAGATSAAAGTAGASGATTAAAGAAAPETGLLATMNKYAPLMNAATTGLSMSGAMGGGDQQAPITPAPVQQAQGGAETLASIANQGGSAATLQADAQERARRRSMIRGMA
ncbi:hypothetical protein [Pseudomonas sp.]|uniref:hypothetical protein n=1 Tax=Pseudomonas sp. TaxID=306 RepID=UPI0025859FCD|nr:hypothetical protein [Pseudomonas sp.]